MGRLNLKPDSEATKKYCSEILSNIDFSINFSVLGFIC